MVARIAKVGLVILGVAVGGAALLLGACDRSPDELRATYANSDSRFLPLASGPTVHYRDEGTTVGATLVLLHGSTSSLHTWEPWVRELRDGARLVTLDLPGHGLTGRHPSDDYTRDGQVEFLAEFVEELGIADFVLGGNSMGGGVALAYALRYPEDVSGLVLISPSYRPRDATRVDYRLAATPVLGRIMAFLTPRFLVERQLRGVVYDDSLVTDAMVDRYRDLILHKGNRVAAIERLAGYAAARPDRLAERLGEIQQPTLVLWGEADFRNPVANAFALERALPHAQLVVYSEVAHVAMEEVPEASAARVRTFLAPFERNSQPTPGRAGAL